MKFGLNLYSLKSSVQTEEDFYKTAVALKDGGYSYLQYSGGPFDAERIKRVSDKSGMPIYLTHVPMERIINDTDALMADHEKFGCYNIGLGYFPKETLLNAQEFYKKVEELNIAGEKMAKSGFKFFYHNHQNEFYKVDGNKTAFDYVLDNAPFINFTLDTYWVQYGGLNVLSLIKKAKGRIGCVHLKDYKINQSMTPEFAPVGDGNLDFKSIISEMEKSDVGYYFVEQDNASELPDGLSQVLKSAKYLKENF